MVVEAAIRDVGAEKPAVGQLRTIGAATDWQHLGLNVCLPDGSKRIVDEALASLALDDLCHVAVLLVHG